MKFLTRILSFFRRNPVEDVETMLDRLEKEQGIPSREANLRKRAKVSDLRAEGSAYHDATMRYLKENPGKELSDYDKLDGYTKASYYD